jgi:hypothetical protein
MKTASTLIAVAVIGFSSALLLVSKTSVAAAQSVESHDSLQQQIVDKEREGLDALKAGDVERFGNLTADEAIMVDAQGPASKAQVL